MKNILFVTIFVVTSFITGCSKNNAPDASEVLFPVTFNVTTFSSDISPMSGPKKQSSLQKQIASQANSSNSNHLASTSIGGAVRYLEYYIMNSEGNIIQERKIDRENIQSGDPEFGRIEMALPLGTYSVLLVGSDGGITFAGKGESSFLYNFATGFEGNYGYSDVFFKLLNISVTDDAIEKSVILERVVGKLEVNLLDEVPNNISRIEYGISNISAFFYPFNFSSNQTGSFTRIAYGGQHDFKEDLYLYFFYQNPANDHLGYANVNIRAYNEMGDVVADKVVNSVPVGINQKTVLTGKLFEDPASNGQGFTVTVNTDWSSTNSVDF